MTRDVRLKISSVLMMAANLRRPKSIYMSVPRVPMHALLATIA